MGHAFDSSAAGAFVYPGDGNSEQLRNFGSADRAVVKFALRRSQRRCIRHFRGVLTVIKDRCHCGASVMIPQFVQIARTNHRCASPAPCACLFLVVGKQIENAVQCVELFPKTPDLTQNGLNFRTARARAPGMANSFFPSVRMSSSRFFNPLGTADEHLNPTWIANKIRLPILIDSFAESLSAQKTGNGVHDSVSGRCAWSVGPEFRHEYARLRAVCSLWYLGIGFVECRALLNCRSARLLPTDAMLFIRLLIEFDYRSTNIDPLRRLSVTNRRIFDR